MTSALRAIVLLGPTGAGKSIVASALAEVYDAILIDEAHVPPVLAHTCGYLGRDDVDRAVSQGLRVHLNNLITARGPGSRLHGLADLAQGRVRAPAMLRWLATGRRQVSLCVVEHNMFSLCPDVIANIFPEGLIVVLNREGLDAAHVWDRTYAPFSDARVRIPTTESLYVREHREVSVPWWVKAGDEDRFVDASPYARTIWLWAEMTRRLGEFASRQPRDRVTSIWYEDLVTEPVATLRPLMTDVAGGDARLASLRTVRRLTTAHIGVHRERSAADLDAARQIAGPELAAAARARSTRGRL